ncbi:alpha/beta fold hydrolase [Paractinoplanes lichenicola]|uniref:Alpha/beta hydrolase n=1 Tax=Paractinoplanes lichenicola TaxID=2802976 RepID=A0ABS1VNT2_9ACTN|nr:alpha/beta hydrolase [Actinoplanes lichenicola]MBL7256397.1 alpha/beta hydrolase [Actinoplanes lichenicola]
MDGIEQINGVNLFVRRFGDPTSPMLVVIHGGPPWDHSYLLPVAELADVAHVVFFDLRGAGRSDHDVPLQPDLIADDVAALIRRFGATRADVLGFSYGGGVAMRLVEQHPSVVGRLILAATTAYGDFEPEIPPERAALCREVPPGDGARAMAEAALPVTIWRLDRAAEWRAILAGIRFSRAWDKPYAEGTLKPARPPDAPGVLRRWGGEVLILHGEREMTFPPSVARRLHAEVPGSRLELIPEAAHMAHFDNPSAWLAAVREFLRG